MKVVGNRTMITLDVLRQQGAGHSGQQRRPAMKRLVNHAKSVTELPLRGVDDDPWWWGKLSPA